MATKELIERDEDVCIDAANFTSLYYEAMDRKRDKIIHLYVSNDLPEMVWNGNTVAGADDIFRFIEQLPTSDHTIQCVDAQRLPAIPDTAHLNQGIVVQIMGTVVMGLATHGFIQNFVLVNEDGKFKVKNDRFRYVD